MARNNLTLILVVSFFLIINSIGASEEEKVDDRMGFRPPCDRCLRNWGRTGCCMFISNRCCNYVPTKAPITTTTKTSAANTAGTSTTGISNTGTSSAGTGTTGTSTTGTGTTGTSTTGTSTTGTSTTGTSTTGTSTTRTSTTGTSTTGTSTTGTSTTGTKTTGTSTTGANAAMKAGIKHGRDVEENHWENQILNEDQQDLENNKPPKNDQGLIIFSQKLEPDEEDFQDF